MEFGFVPGPEVDKMVARFDAGGGRRARRQSVRARRKALKPRKSKPPLPLVAPPAGTFPGHNGCRTGATFVRSRKPEEEC
jgi:hypothetical protein